MDIELEVNKILKEQGVSPPNMTHEQFFEEFARRFDQEVPHICTESAARIMAEIAADEMAKIGRSIPCRHAGDKKKKYCNKIDDCYSCLNYKPIPRWWRWLTIPRNTEISFIVFATLSFIAAVAFPPISPWMLGVWFGVVVVTRLQYFQLNKMLREMKKRPQL